VQGEAFNLRRREGTFLTADKTGAAPNGRRQGTKSKTKENISKNLFKGKRGNRAMEHDVPVRIKNMAGEQAKTGGFFLCGEGTGKLNTADGVERYRRGSQHNKAEMWERIHREKEKPPSSWKVRNKSEAPDVAGIEVRRGGGGGPPKRN